ncbi:unnamed protein product [Dibothriocephalus latus]|uniref:Integrase zinc-binding domain-containing protein n=1 Tax=Dibothriocephalus latus TaxID=60516 RepID=A0A3P7LDM8_DIBLA|nr:unnamed protein product [Dibothriocephalus latus]
MTVYVESEVNSLLMDSIRALSVTFEEVRKATKQDLLLRQVIKYHRNQWPAKTSGELRQFHQRRNSLSTINDGILFYDRVVAPQQLQARVLRKFHNGHPGINRMKAVARNYVNWSHVNQQPEQLA